MSSRRPLLLHDIPDGIVRVRHLRPGVPDLSRLRRRRDVRVPTSPSLRNGKFWVLCNGSLIWFGRALTNTMRLPCVRKTQQAGEDKVARDSGAAAAGGRRNKPETQPYVIEVIPQKRLAAAVGTVRFALQCRGGR